PSDEPSEEPSDQPEGGELYDLLTSEGAQVDDADGNTWTVQGDWSEAGDLSADATEAYTATYTSDAGELTFTAASFPTRMRASAAAPAAPARAGVRAAARGAAPGSTPTVAMATASTGTATPRWSSRWTPTTGASPAASTARWTSDQVHPGLTDLVRTHAQALG